MTRDLFFRFRVALAVTVLVAIPGCVAWVAASYALASALDRQCFSERPLTRADVESCLVLDIEAECDRVKGHGSFYAEGRCVEYRILGDSPIQVMYLEDRVVRTLPAYE